MQNFVNYAHRGASEYLPENTLLAFYTGIYMGANGIETDVQRTRDGVLVLFHDDTLQRVTGQSGCIADYTFEQLQQLVRDVEKELKGQYTEVPVHLIGETIMHRLMDMDEVAYVRFASVYKEFDDVQTFIREIEVMKERK